MTNTVRLRKNVGETAPRTLTLSISKHSFVDLKRFLVDPGS
jgi:hypothetical protein